MQENPVVTVRVVAIDAVVITSCDCLLGAAQCPPTFLHAVIALLDSHAIFTNS
jgi:hypothetical protein